MSSIFNQNKKNISRFCSIFKKFKKYDLIFVSSNSGTGKTTFFKWLLIRKAIKGELKVDFYFRYENEIETKFNTYAFLKPPVNASKRLLKLCEKVDILKENENYFLINKKTQEKIGQALSINTQKKYKSTENAIYSDFAFYDECMPDDGQYCPNEVYKFSRLIDTRARHRKYKVLCTYNKTQPFFPYRESFEKAGALFIDFVGNKFNQPNNLQGIQKVLSKSDYGSIYNENNYQEYCEFYKKSNAVGCEVLFYLYIQNYCFCIKSVEDYIFLIPTKKTKKNKPILSLSIENNEYPLIDRKNGIVQFLTQMVSNRHVFVNSKRYTIFVKILADYLNLSYTI